MRFKIRFADQIVGLFIILSLAALVFVIIMLGQSQRWFSKDVFYYTNMPTADGLSNNMPVQYRGFTIGNVKTFHLNENDDVEVIFFIYEGYHDRVKQGSMVEKVASPIGLGSSFIFYAGKGLNLLPENTFIPVVGSPQARELIRQGLADEPRYDDIITMALNQITSTLEEVNEILANVNEALGPGSRETEIGKIVGSLQKIIEDAESIPQTIDLAGADISKLVDEILSELSPALANINILTNELVDPDGLLFTMLNTDEEVYTSLTASLRSISSILNNLDETIAFLPSQTPQIAGMIIELRQTLKAAEDVMIALSNNPLLRGGVPQRPETQSGTSPRDLRF